MNIFNNNQHEPARLEPTHKKPGILEQCLEFWLNNQYGIVLFTIAVMIIILLFMICYAAGTGHIHFLSTEANRYEHMNQIIFYAGGVIPWVE